MRLFYYVKDKDTWDEITTSKLFFNEKNRLFRFIFQDKSFILGSIINFQRQRIKNLQLDRLTNWLKNNKK